MKQLTVSDLDALSQQARQSPRRRANYNLHPELADPIQRLAIAMEPDTVVLPHHHPHTFELLFPLRGRFLVLHFDDSGRVTGRTVLGEEAGVLENPAGTWHAVLSLDEGGVIFEVKHGPYLPVVEGDYAPWAKGWEEGKLLAWYAKAAVGDTLVPAN
ncbi:MAG: WbuC family cupin fold metalloprotein [Sulfuricellaceae bacterium]